MDVVVQVPVGTDHGAIFLLFRCEVLLGVCAAQPPLRRSGLSGPLTLGKAGCVSGSKSRNPVSWEQLR